MRAKETNLDEPGLETDSDIDQIDDEEAREFLQASFKREPSLA